MSTLTTISNLRQSKIMQKGELVACRRFNGAPHEIARVVRPALTSGYYIVCGMNNITHWGEWSGAMDSPEEVSYRCFCQTQILITEGCQCGGV